MIRHRRLDQEPRIEEVKTLNEQYAAEVGEHKRVEIELTRSKSEVANERAQIAERLVRIYPYPYPPTPHPLLFLGSCVFLFLGTNF